MKHMMILFSRIHPPQNISDGRYSENPRADIPPQEKDINLVHINSGLFFCLKEM